MKNICGNNIDECATLNQNLCSAPTTLGDTIRKACPVLCRTPPCQDLPMCQNMTFTEQFCELRSQSLSKLLSVKELCPIGCGGKFLCRNILSKFTREISLQYQTTIYLINLLYIFAAIGIW